MSKIYPIYRFGDDNDVTIPTVGVKTKTSLKKMFNRRFYIADQFGFVAGSNIDNSAAWDRMYAFLGEAPTDGFAEPADFTMNVNEPETHDVYFPKGTFEIQSSKIVTKTNVRVVGAGKKLTNLFFRGMNGANINLKIGEALPNSRKIAWHTCFKDLRITTSCVGIAGVDLDCPTKNIFDNVDIVDGAYSANSILSTIGVRVNNGQWDGFYNVGIFGYHKAGIWFDSDINTPSTNPVGATENWASQFYCHNLRIVMSDPVAGEICASILFKDSLVNNPTQFRFGGIFNVCSFQIYSNGNFSETSKSAMIMCDDSISPTIPDVNIVFRDCFAENFQYVLQPGNNANFKYLFDNCGFYGNGNGIECFPTMGNRNSIELRSCTFVGAGNIFGGTCGPVHISGQNDISSNGTPANGTFDDKKIFPVGGNYTFTGRFLLNGAAVHSKKINNVPLQLASFNSHTIELKTNIRNNRTKFTISFENVSLDTVSNLQIQVQVDNTTWITSGYLSRCAKNGVYSAASSSGIFIGEAAGIPLATRLMGMIEIISTDQLDSSYQARGTLSGDSPDVFYEISSRFKLITGVITGIRIRSQNGTSIFDDGEIVLIEE